MTSHHHERIQTYEPEAFPELEPTNAQLALDYMRVTKHPAVRPLVELDLGDGETHGQFNQYAQQFVLYRMFVQGVIGNREDLSARTIMDTEVVAAGVMDLTLRGVNEFHNAFSAYTKAQGIDGRTQAEKIISGDINDNITLMTNDVVTLYRQGLVEPDGRSGNLQYVGRILRVMNATLLFSDQLQQPGMVDAFYDRMYEVAVGDKRTEGHFNQYASNYAEQYAKPVTRGNIIRKIRRQLGSNVDEVTNRAALMLVLANAKGTLTAAQSAPDLRERYAEAFRAIGSADDLPELNSEIIGLMDRLRTASTAKRSAGGADNIAESISQAMRLDWEVLPPGELEMKARDIVEIQSRPGKEVSIDLERLNILVNIRKEWGEDRSYYAHGSLGKRRVVKEGGKEESDQYLMLILQEIDASGKVVMEHAVAESPIAGPNALYVFRQDVSEGLSWREVMALPKEYARAFKARAVKHTQPRNASEGSLVASMSEKVAMLMACEPHEFSTLQFQGGRGFRLPKGILPEVDISTER